MKNRIDEGEIKGSIDTITMGQTETILKQMKKSICKIYGQQIGTGFFCKLEYKGNTIPTLITNYHIIDDKFVESNKTLKIQLNNEKVTKMINLNKNKIIYSSRNQEYDIMIINLDKEDDISDIDCLEIDDYLLNHLLNHNSEIVYDDSSIYILHYPLGKEVSVSFGYGISREKGNNFDIIHKCKTVTCSSGSPILNLSTNKVIGIHKSYINSLKKDSYNIGTFLKNPLIQMKTNIKEINNYKLYERIVINNRSNEAQKENKYENSELKYDKTNKKIKCMNRSKNESPKDNHSHDKYKIKFNLIGVNDKTHTPKNNFDLNKFDNKMINNKNLNYNNISGINSHRINKSNIKEKDITKKNNNNENSALNEDNFNPKNMKNLNINNEIKKRNLYLNNKNILTKNKYRYYGYNTNPNTKNKNNLINDIPKVNYVRNKDDNIIKNRYQNNNNRQNKKNYIIENRITHFQEATNIKQNKKRNFVHNPSTPDLKNGMRNIYLKYYRNYKLSKNLKYIN